MMVVLVKMEDLEVLVSRVQKGSRGSRWDALARPERVAVRETSENQDPQDQTETQDSPDSQDPQAAAHARETPASRVHPERPG